MKRQGTFILEAASFIQVHGLCISNTSDTRKIIRIQLFTRYPYRLKGKKRGR